MNRIISYYQNQSDGLIEEAAVCNFISKNYMGTVVLVGKMN